MSAPTEFFVRLQKGIVGGFAPPTPDAVYTLAKASSNPSSLLITAAVRPDGSPELQESAAPKFLKDSVDTNALVAELYSILSVIPVESPQGSEDIYGLNTSIAWGSAGLEWVNGGPQGCSGGTSSVQPTQEEKAKFVRAVEIVNQLVNTNE